MITEIKTPYGFKMIHKDDILYKIEENNKKSSLMLIISGNLEFCIEYVCNCYRWSKKQLEIKVKK